MQKSRKCRLPSAQLLFFSYVKYSNNLSVGRDASVRFVSRKTSEVIENRSWVDRVSRLERLGCGGYDVINWRSNLVVRCLIALYGSFYYTISPRKMNNPARCIASHSEFGECAETEVSRQFAFLTSSSFLLSKKCNATRVHVCTWKKLFKIASSWDWDFGFEVDCSRPTEWADGAENLHKSSSISESSWQRLTFISSWNNKLIAASHTHTRWWAAVKSVFGRRDQFQLNNSC